MMPVDSPPRVLVSACLLGAEVRHHGGDARVDDAILDRWRNEGRIVGVCPEMAGGLGSPRPPAESIGGDGARVLAGTATVLTKEGKDVTGSFVAGAALILSIARELGVRVAVLKSRSPSCGISQVYDGTFSGSLVAGLGVTAAALQQAGVRLFDETQLAEADAALCALEREAQL